MTILREEIIGDCRLLLGDCREILPMIGKVDAIVTDPPYDFVPTGGGIGGRRQVYKDIFKAGIHLGFDPDILLGISDSITVFCAKGQIARMIKFATDNSFRWNLTTFNKTNPTPLCGGNYLPDTEYIFHFWKNCRLGGGYKDKSRFFVSAASGDSSIHPTIKPVILMEKLLRVSIDHHDPVYFDPFMGSGTTLLAAARLGRKAVGIEIDPRYFEIACKRIREAYAQPDMLIEAARKPVQDAFL